MEENLPTPLMKEASSTTTPYSKEDLIGPTTSPVFIFLNVAALPVLTIVLRNNSMKLLTPEKFPKVSYQLTSWTLIYTSVILSLVLISSITL